MECRYRYVKLPGEEKRLFCVEQNPLILAWVLFFKENTLAPATMQISSKKWSVQWLKDLVRKYISFSRINLWKLKVFIEYKYRKRSIAAWVELPFYGQICVLVNKGYKIFDLHRRVAIKVYRADVDISTIETELDHLKHSSLFTFGPLLGRMNITERWYEESYISGSLTYWPGLRNSLDWPRKFYGDTIPCLMHLILHQPPLKINTVDYLNDMGSSMKTPNLRKQVSDGGQLKKILSFIYSIDIRIRSRGNIPVFLVLTHGDFCTGNMLNTKHGLRVLDWESATQRSALFDFYSYFFHRPVDQNIPIKQLSEEISIALPNVISRLDLTSPDISASLKSFVEVYRWLYYYERIHMLIGRMKYDTKHNIMVYILRCIEVFSEYEELSGESYRYSRRT